MHVAVLNERDISKLGESLAGFRAIHVPGYLQCLNRQAGRHETQVGNQAKSLAVDVGGYSQPASPRDLCHGLIERDVSRGG